MSKYYVLFNPLSDNGNGEKGAHRLDGIYPGESLEYRSLLEIGSYGNFFASAEPDSSVIICGGDGTLNRFVNSIENVSFENEILYFPSGTGNDFARDLGHFEDQRPFAISEYIRNLPSVTVKTQRKLFLNGIGYGIDGYCCEIGDRKKEAGEKKINYAAIAIQGLLFHFKPTNAKVTVDGKEYEYKKVWLAPTMNGRFYGGGMMPTPDQKRNSGELSVMIFHKSGKLKTLMIFPSIFKGEHVKNKDYVEVIKGKNITVKFSRPTPLQIDGETVLGVTSYTVQA